MEDEIASIAAIVGASWNNYRTMTTTSGLSPFKTTSEVIKGPELLIDL